MKEFLIRIKIIDYLRTDLSISRNEFVDKLYGIVAEGSTGLFSNPFEAFSSDRREFKGHVDSYGFKIKRRARFFETNQSSAIANGTFNEHNGILRVETEINGFNNFFIFFYVFLIPIYSLVFFSMTKSKNINFFVPTFLLFHAMFMFGIPYFMMRRATRRMKYELEREFYYLTKK